LSTEYALPNKVPVDRDESDILNSHILFVVVEEVEVEVVVVVVMRWWWCGERLGVKRKNMEKTEM
jgi:hypothetical protein